MEGGGLIQQAFITSPPSALFHLYGGKIPASEKILSNLGSQVLADLFFISSLSASRVPGSVSGADQRSRGD